MPPGYMEAAETLPGGINPSPTGHLRKWLFAITPRAGHARPLRFYNEIHLSQPWIDTTLPLGVF